MPTTDQKSESKPVRALPGQEFSCWSAGAMLECCSAAAVILSVSPPQPPTRCRPSRVSGSSERDDDEELQDLVVDRGRQAAEGDVGEHDRGRDDQGDPQRPAEQRVDDAAEQVEVDAGDQQLGDRERDRVDQVGAGAEPAAHELGNRPHLRAVVERHHHDAEEQHRRDRADPEVVHGREAELGAVRRHAHDLDGAEVGRDEGQAGDPGRQRAARRGRSRASRRPGVAPGPRCPGRRRSRGR